MRAAAAPSYIARRQMPKLRICLVSSEVAPFAKTGGLADVAAGLPRFLAAQGHDVRVFTPHYATTRAEGIAITPEPRAQGIGIDFGGRRVHVSLATARLPGAPVDVLLVQCPELYGRASIYTMDPDEPVRFAALCRAALEACQRLGWGPQIFHVNDWHTALLPLYLKTLYAWDRLFDGARTVLTIHNVGYQGVFPSEVLDALGLSGERHLLPQEDLHEHRFGFLKTGVVHADALTTVSRTYAREIQTQELGMGFDGVLRAHSGKLRGIVNGIDYGEWNPEVDPLIPQRYSARDLSGKAANRQALLARVGLAAPARVPVIGMVTRLTHQKGLQLLPEVLPGLLARTDFRLIVLGSGEERFERWFQHVRDEDPSKIAIYRGYHDELAHWIEAGSDVFLMPSLYEPCGLNQMYSLKYGTVPVVRRTGGLADTVTQFDPRTGKGTGFLFDEFTPAALSAALFAALDTHRNQAAWKRLLQNGMAQDFSWDRQGRHYVELYEELLKR